MSKRARMTHEETQIETNRCSESTAPRSDNWERQRRGGFWTG